MTHVLLVDDDRRVLEALELMYSIHPRVRRVSCARTLREAMGVLRCSRVDVVSIDIDLGKDSGLDLCHVIHRTMRDTFIIMCSANGSSEMRRTAKLLGSHEYLQKPVGLSDINRIMSEYSKWQHRILNSSE